MTTVPRELAITFSVSEWELIEMALNDACRETPHGFTASEKDEARALKDHIYSAFELVSLQAGVSGVPHTPAGCPE